MRNRKQVTSIKHHTALLALMPEAAAMPYMGWTQIPITIWAARSIGADFHCHLVEYRRTIVYKVPGLKVKGREPAPCVILDDPEFKASMVVDPFPCLNG